MPLPSSFRLEMLQVARLAPKLLGESAELVASFLRGRLSDSGGFVDREGRPDLYYTVFGVEAMLALQLELPREKLAAYLRECLDPARLDFVHLCSLARAAAGIGGDVFTSAEKNALRSRLEEFRTPDGGYHAAPGKTHGSAYGALLAWGAHSDLGATPHEPERLLDSLLALQLPDGSFANEPGIKEGSTTATGAAVTLCRGLGHKINPATGEWLLRQMNPGGGFLATPRAPLPDLLSTAVALHALDSMEMLHKHSSLIPPPSPTAVDSSFILHPSSFHSSFPIASCLDFIDSLWSAEGGFHGHWADDHLDCEYTYYGLLALGHLVGMGK